MAIVVSNKTNISNFVQGNVRPVISISAATTLTTAESGSIVTVGKGAAYTITMPAPTTAGLEFHFVGGAVAANIVDIACGAGLLDGVVMNVGGAPPAAAVLAAAASANARFLAASVIGDWLTLRSDGTHWKVSGASSVVGFGFS